MIVFHYTSNRSLTAILRDGEIHTSTRAEAAFAGSAELSGVWFSARRDHEPTALRPTRDEFGRFTEGAELVAQIRQRRLIGS
jgi:hypothetical protein